MLWGLNESDMKKIIIRKHMQYICESSTRCELGKYLKQIPIRAQDLHRQQNGG